MTFGGLLQRRLSQVANERCLINDETSRTPMVQPPEDKGYPVTMPLERQERAPVWAKKATESEEPVDAVSPLIAEHWERLCQIIFRLVGDWSEAEDLVLEAFYRLHEQLAAGKQIDNPTGWLYRVATNQGLNVLRSRRRQRYYENQAVSLELPGEAENPAHTAEQRLEQAQVRQVLRQLKPRAAQLLLLRHSGLSYQEIAQALQLAPTSIGSLLARAEKEFAARYRKSEEL